MPDAPAEAHRRCLEPAGAPRERMAMSEMEALAAELAALRAELGDDLGASPGGVQPLS